MRKSLKLLTSGIPGRSLSSLSQSSSGQELKNQRSLLKQRIVDRLKAALGEVEQLSKAKRMVIVTLITQALDTITDAELLEMLAVAEAEFDAILLEFGR